MPVEGCFKLAAIQARHVMFDRDAATEKACRLIGEAAAGGATIAAFGETWLHGYPFFADAAFAPLCWQATAEYQAHAVEIPGPTTEKLCATARKGGVDVVIGIVERNSKTLGTVYCTLLFIGKEGTHSRPAPQAEGHACGAFRLGRRRRRRAADISAA